MINYETYLAGKNDDVLVLKLIGRLDDRTAANLDL